MYLYVGYQPPIRPNKVEEDKATYGENVGVRDSPEKCSKTERCRRYLSWEKVSRGHLTSVFVKLDYYVVRLASVVSDFNNTVSHSQFG